MEHHAEVMARLGKPFTIEWFDAGHGVLGQVAGRIVGIPGDGSEPVLRCGCRRVSENVTHGPDRIAQAVSLSPIYVE
jgi:hypothetical protein